MHTLLSRQHIAQEKLLSTHKICASCSATPLHDRIMCDSIDCPMLYARVQAHRDVEDLVDVQKLLGGLELNAQQEEEVSAVNPWDAARLW